MGKMENEYQRLKSSHGGAAGASNPDGFSSPFSSCGITSPLSPLTSKHSRLHRMTSARSLMPQERLLMKSSFEPSITDHSSPKRLSPDLTAHAEVRHRHRLQNSMGIGSCDPISPRRPGAFLLRQRSLSEMFRALEPPPCD